MPVEIIPYNPAYWQDICQVHDQARKQELRLANLDAAFLPLETVAQTEGLFDYPHLDIALADGQAVGFCAYTGEELAWLYVRPDKMRQGIGRALAAHALQTEPDISCIEVLYGNDPAKALYESLGFTVKETLTGQMPGNEQFQVKVYSMSR